MHYYWIFLSNCVCNQRVLIRLLTLIWVYWPEVCIVYRQSSSHTLMALVLGVFPIWYVSFVLFKSVYSQHILVSLNWSQILNNFSYSCLSKLGLFVLLGVKVFIAIFSVWINLQSCIFHGVLHSLNWVIFSQQNYFISINDETSSLDLLDTIAILGMYPSCP